MSHHCGHDHDMCGYTDCYCGHYHRIKDQETKDAKTVGNGYDHVHYYEGETSKDAHHRHHICYYTGPAIPASCECGHYHYFYGITTCDDGHTHYYRGITDIEDYD